MFFAILMMGILEVVGIASILPFMALIAEPEAITTTPWLCRAYVYFGFESYKSMLFSTGLLVIILITLTNLASIGILWLKFNYTWNVAHNLGIRLLQTYLKKPYSFFLTTNTSKLRTYLFSEVGGLTNGVLMPIIDLISRAIVVLFIFILLVSVNPKVAVVIFAILGGAYGMIYLSRQRVLRKLGQDRIEANTNRFSSLDELLTGVKTIRVYGIDLYFYNRYEKASKEFCDIQPRAQLIAASPRYLLEILAFGGILSVTLYMFIKAENVQKILPILSLYALAGYRLLPSLQNAFAAAAKLRHSYPVLDKLYDDLLVGLHTDKPAPKRTGAQLFRKEIQLRSVSYQYDKMPNPVLDNLNLNIKRGEVVAFVGATGSGKTTLIDLIVGLLPPTEGSISLDGIELNSNNVHQWQQQIAYVPQDVFLFDDTVAKNIAIGQDTDEIDYKQLEKVSRLADIHEFIVNELPDAFQAKIGERGVRLSGGQRQRLGLARALYQNPNVLILDEATSALDSITEKGIIDSLKTLPEELTILVIAHRLSTVRYANCIYLLQEGKIIEKGSYEKLISSSDIFRTMVELS